MFFNPCSHLAISDYYPLAKVRRATLWERLEDTFEVFNGKIVDHKSNYLSKNIGPKESHIGILDCLLFPVLLPLMWHLKDKPDSRLTKFVMSLKSIVSFFLTVGCSLFVIIGHGISLAIIEKEDIKIKNLNIIADTSHEETNRRECIDEDVLTKTKKTVTIEEKRKIEEKNCKGQLSGIAPCEQRLENSTYVVNRASDTGKNELYLSVNNIDNECCFPFSDYSFFNVKIPVTEENKPGIRWMLESNYTHILEKLPAHSLKDLVNEIEQPVKPRL